MKIEIHNPSNLPLIDYRQVKPLQGNLKDLKESNYNKLRIVLLKRGFTVPLFVWHPPMWQPADATAPYFLMDGHQRQRVMLKEDMQPYEVPYILIEAKNQKEAKAQLLEISSQFGTITQEGFDEFTDELENEDFEDISFDALAFVGQDEDEGDEENKNNDNHAIIVTFGNLQDLDNCLPKIQTICKDYESVKVKVKE